jgi:hypothetical protein
MMSAVEWFRAPLTIVGALGKWGPYADEKEAVLASMDVIDEVRPDWPDAAKKIALAIGWAESRFGLPPDWQFPPGPGRPEGAPSYNWGAMVMTGSAGTLPHADHTADGKPVTWGFAAWNTAEEGFGAWARMMERPGLAPALKAMREGNALGVAEGMYADCLFSGTCPPDCSDTARIERYGKLILGAVKHLAPLGDWTPDEVKLGALAGVPMGKCSWHDNYKGGGGGGGGGGGVKTPAADAASSSSGAGWVIGAVALVGGIWLLR